MSEPDTTPDAKAVSAPKTVDAYVQGFPNGPREILEQVRDAMRRGAPGSEEKIRYGMPALMFRDRYGLHFAGWKKHYSIYPAGSRLIAAFEKELEPYDYNDKGTIRFSLDEPVPARLLARIAKFRVSEEAERATLRATARKKRIRA